MKIIFIKGIQGRSTAVWVPSWAKIALSCCLLGLPMGAGFWLGAQLHSEGSHFFGDVADALEADISDQKESVEETREEVNRRLQAMTLRLGQMQAKLSRIEALGEILTEKAELDDGEFNFSEPPALGGPSDLVSTQALSELETLQMLENMSMAIDNRAMQLNMVSDLIQDRHINRENQPSGLPAGSGWISSFYGNRTDPFTGKQAWHNGVDIAGKLGTDILSVAAGVVTYSGELSGYGNTVEITHDNGFVTRYGHGKDLLVALGEIVKKGQVIASMGSTGRSTGPHVHFEVYKNGRSVDPASYIRRTIR